MHMAQLAMCTKCQSLVGPLIEQTLLRAVSVEKDRILQQQEKKLAYEKDLIQKRLEEQFNQTLAIQSTEMRERYKTKLARLRNKYEEQCKQISVAQIEHVRKLKSDLIQAYADREKALNEAHNKEISTMLRQLEDVKTQNLVMPSLQIQTLKESQKQLELCIQNEQGKVNLQKLDNERLQMRIEILTEQLGSLQRENFNLQQSSQLFQQQQNFTPETQFQCVKCPRYKMECDKLTGKVKKLETLLNYQRKESALRQMGGSSVPPLSVQALSPRVIASRVNILHSQKQLGRKQY
ncbi:hypothetical protein FGO68_gene8174 [Halteria grandinella]|uniref:Uncharacterized protein n=1 Tax=Halteria grandinella TaxID=5974 RepID=A0A8J8T540_HALGN|nr:hypothetical protein FGO68_gene8174 [Halteria grandinella]